MRRVHPKTGEVMEEHRNQDGSLWGPGLKLYSNLRPPAEPQTMPEGFYVYVPEPKPALVQVASGVVQAAVEARRKRILEKEKSSAATAVSEHAVTGEEIPSQDHPQYASAAGDDLLETGDENRSKKRLVEVEPGDTLEIPSGSPTYLIACRTIPGRRLRRAAKRGGSLESKSPPFIRTPAAR